jgi:hypothetical protein
MRVSRLQRLQRRLVPPRALRSQRLVPMSRSERSRHADTVWVSGLQREHTSAVLSQYFERFGAVAQVSACGCGVPHRREVAHTRR